MFRQSSGLLSSSSAPAIGNGHVALSHVQEKQPSRGNRSYSISTFRQPVVDDNQGSGMDPDELFTKHTIAEIKLVQKRLRADADAKQEELRLMVGERYRDLLQASTSIMSLASSSRAVQQTLKEIKEIVLSQNEPPLPQEPSSNGESDTHLRTLELLSAHIKLLLDAPEHLWRLLETKKYFQATWLFLLARVVYQALVREDDQDEDSWRSQGMDVPEDFPLVQRQWDVVSQFRSQIIHKATLSLREYDSSVEDVCAALLTLLLLDSRPLSEVLLIFFTQRSKTLHTMLSWQPESEQTGKSNGDVPEKLAPSEFRRKPVNLVKEATHSALNTLSQTVKTARSIFQAKNDSDPSLIRHVLEFIESDSRHDHLPDSNKRLTALYLSTQTLLATLPSSNHLLLLPSNITSYKPYIDLSSPSLSIQHLQFAPRLYDWFQQSCSGLQKAVTTWFAELQSIKEIWSVRMSTKRWLFEAGLDNNEVMKLAGILDDLCQERITEVWKSKLARSFESFDEQLDSTFSTLNRNATPSPKNYSSSEFLFQAPPLPATLHAGLVPPDLTFQKYRASLRRQLIGRTTLLDDVLATLENCARTIRQDLAYIAASVEESQGLVEQLENNHSPDADALSYKVVEKLEKMAQTPVASSSSTLDGFIFLGRISEELASSSPFIAGVGCNPSVMKEFRDKTTALHDRIIDRWRTHTISQIVLEYHLHLRPIHPTLQASFKPHGPSPDLIQSLLALSDSIQELGITRNPPKRQTLVQVILKQFILELISEEGQRDDLQSLHDTCFLWKLASTYNDGWVDFSTMLEEQVKEKLPENLNLEEIQQSASESLTRMQTLFATLLPTDHHGVLSSSSDKSSALLPFGVPLLDQQFQPAIELAKPTARFGLLLVGGS